MPCTLGYTPVPMFAWIADVTAGAEPMVAFV
jgi:hypothetical protein